jgi:hypothetical protein
MLKSLHNCNANQTDDELRRIAELVGVSDVLYRVRIHRGWSPLRAATTPSRERSANGRRQTYRRVVTHRQKLGVILANANQRISVERYLQHYGFNVRPPSPPSRSPRSYPPLPFPFRPPPIAESQDD